MNDVQTEHAKTPWTDEERKAYAAKRAAEKEAKAAAQKAEQTEGA